MLVEKYELSILQLTACFGGSFIHPFILAL